ncbi:MAG: YhjD/YihY/BrkB family envelope integrity protein [Solirubrobacteraceae bacterium]
MPATRLKSWRQRLTGRLDAAHARLDGERERHLTVALAFTIADRGRRTGASVLAGALAFRFFLTLLPLTLVAVVGLGFLRSAGGAPSDALQQFGIKGVLASTINQSASFSDPGRTAVLLLAVVGVLSGTRTTAAAIRAIHALAWGLPVPRWRQKSAAGLILLGVMIVVICCGGLATRARVDAGTLLGLGASILIALVIGGVWLAVSRLLPHPEGLRWSAFLPGAVLVGCGFALLQAVTANWIGPKLEHDGALYGSLGVAFVILGWLYVVGRLLVGAPLLNAAVLDHRSPGRHKAVSRAGPG